MSMFSRDMDIPAVVKPPEPGAELTIKTAVKGLAVQLTTDPQAFGIIVRKAGPNVSVDFSGSGGEKSKWIPMGQLVVRSEVAVAEPGVEITVPTPTASEPTVEKLTAESTTFAPPATGLPATEPTPAGMDTSGMDDTYKEYAEMSAQVSHRAAACS